jgi:hypothetical protein
MTITGKLLSVARYLAIALGITASAAAQQLPAGSVGVLTNNTANTWQTFSYTFTPTTTGANFVGFAFRQDPAFWTFDNVRLTTAGSTTNLLTNGGFDTGGRFNITTNNGASSIQAPTNWGVWYQNGTYPAAAGAWQDGPAPRGGVWYDGAVGTFDGIYQGVNLTAGTTYTITFDVSGNNVANTSSIQLGTYGGACDNVSVAPDQCMIPSSAGFTTLATPAQGAAAGAPAVTPVGNPTAGTISGTPSTVYGNWIAWATVSTDARTNSGSNGVVTRTVNNYDRRTVTSRVTVTPTSTQNYSDGTSVTTNGTPYNQDTLQTPQQRLGSFTTAQASFNRMGLADVTNIQAANPFMIDPLMPRDENWVSPRASYHSTGNGTYSASGVDIGKQWTADGNIFGFALNFGQGRTSGYLNGEGNTVSYAGTAYGLVKEEPLWYKVAFGASTSDVSSSTSLPLFSLINVQKARQNVFYADLGIYSPETFENFRPLLGALVSHSQITDVKSSGSVLIAPDAAKSNTQVLPYVGVRYEFDPDIGLEFRATQTRDFGTVGGVRVSARKSITDEVSINTSIGADLGKNYTGFVGMIGLNVKF